VRDVRGPEEGSLKLDKHRVLRARERLGFSIAKTAQAARVSEHSVLRAEHGEDIRPLTARKIAKGLGVKVADLYNDSPKEKAPEEAPPSLQAPLFINGGDKRDVEEERRSLGEDYLTARRQAHKLLHVHRQRIDQLANRWERQGEPTPEELREEVGHLEGLVEAGLFEIRAPKSPALDALVDTAALDEADRFEVEMIRKGVARLRDVAKRVLADEEAERARRTFQVIAKAS
jgi:transcriptional regulator with XRE-family HTH domain